MSSNSPPELRVASYNIRAGLGTDLRRSADRTVAVIDRLDADVILLQEADFRLGARPASLARHRFGPHREFVSVPVPHNEVSMGWHGNAILVRPTTVIEEVHLMDLPGLEPRGAIAADLTLGGRRARVVGVHLGLLRSSRRKQLHAIREQLARMPMRPTIIAGDFNEWAATRGTEPLAPDFRVHSMGFSYPSRRPFLHYDRMACSKDLHLKAFGVIREGEARRASDHLPVWGHFVPGHAG